MSLGPVLRSPYGKIIMVLSTVLAAISADYIGGRLFDRSALEMQAIKRGIVEGGGNIDGLSDAQILRAWKDLALDVKHGLTDPPYLNIYTAVNKQLSEINTYIQPEVLLTATIVTVAVIVAWYVIYRVFSKSDMDAPEFRPDIGQIPICIVFGLLLVEFASLFNSFLDVFIENYLAAAYFLVLYLIGPALVIILLWVYYSRKDSD